MRNIKILIIIISYVVIISCEKNNENKPVVIELTTSDSVEITNSEFEVRVYGYDPNFQDVSATLIAAHKFHTFEIPYVFQLDLPENAADLVEFVNDPKYIIFYLNISWDSDGNGKICNGDLSINYKTGIPKLILNKFEIQKIDLSKIKSTVCN